MVPYASTPQSSAPASFAMQPGAFENYNLTSTLQDFDLFNSFDWTFDESVPYVWPS